MEIITQEQFSELIKAHERWIANNNEKGEYRRKLSISDKNIGSDGEENLRVKGVDLSKSFFEKCEFEAVIFYHVCFDEALFNFCTFRMCKFKDCSFLHTDFQGSRMLATTFTDCELRCVSAYNATLNYSHFVGCRGRHLFFYDTFLTKITFVRCRFGDVKPQGNTICGEVKGLPVYQCVRGFGSRQGTLTLYARGKQENWRWFAGCFEGSEAELRAAIAKTHKNTNRAKSYYRAIDYLIDTALMDKRTKTNINKN